MECGIREKNEWQMMMECGSNFRRRMMEYGPSIKEEHRNVVQNSEKDEYNALTECGSEFRKG